MDLNAYLRLIRRWLWLIILAAIVAGTYNFVTTRNQPIRYVATTTLEVGSTTTVANPDPGAISLSTMLTTTYAQIALKPVILDAVAKKLQLPLSGAALAGLITVQPGAGTPFLTINAYYTDPIVAADLANAVAEQLIAYSPTDTTKIQKDQIATLQGEITDTQTQLQSARNELNTVQAALKDPAVQNLDVLTARQTELVTEINAETANLASLQQTLITLQSRGNNNTLMVIDPATVPTSGVNSTPAVSAVTAAVVGGVLAIGLAFIIEYFNNLIRSPSEIMTILNTPLLGAVAPIGRKGTYKNKLITWTQPRSAITEAYRAIRVNLLFRDEVEEGTCRFYVVTSAGPGEGKSVTASNLAVTFAMAGMRVLLIDADLRRPTIHSIFNLPNTAGLSTIWGKSQAERDEMLIFSNTGRNTDQSMMQGMRSNLRMALSSLPQKTEIPSLEVITAGPTIANSSELLSTVQLKFFVEEIAANDMYDVVIFDTPPVLVVTDTSIVANLTKAKVLMIVESGKTNRASAARAVQVMQNLGLPIIGVIMNRLKPQDRDADYGYYYYYGYTGYNEQMPKVGRPEKVEQNGRSGAN